MAFTGPKPIETVENCQNSGINLGCGYEDKPSVKAS